MLVKESACIRQDGPSEREIYLLKWPSDLLTDIILGPRLSKENEEAIRSLASTTFPNALIRRAELDTVEFSLKIK